MSRIRSILLLVLLGTAVAPASASATVAGRVLAPTGDPATDAEIHYIPIGLEYGCPSPGIGSIDNLAVLAGVDWGIRKPARISPAVSDRSGRFSIEVPADTTLALLATAPGSLAPVLRVASGSSPELTLAPGRTVELEILGRDDMPLPGARVTLVPLDVCPRVLEALESVLVRRGSTDDEGRIEFAGVPEGTFAIRLEAPEHLSTSVGPLVVTDGRTGYRLRLRAGRELQGLTVHTEGSAGNEGFVLAWWDQGGLLGFARAPVSNDGRWQLAGLPEGGSIRLVAGSAAGFGPAREVRTEQLGPALVGPLDPPGRTGWWGQIDPPGEVGRLIVIPSRPGLPRFRPDDLAAMEILVDERGLFLVPNLSTDVSKLNVVAVGFGAADLSLAGRSTRDLGLVILDRVETSEGRLQWQSGKPAAGLPLVVVAGNQDCRTRSTIDGTFACAWQSPPADEREHLSVSGNAGVHFSAMDDALRALPSPVRSIRATSGEAGNPAEYLALTSPAARAGQLFARAPGGTLELRGEFEGQPVAAAHADDPRAIANPVGSGESAMTVVLPVRPTVSGDVRTEHDGSPIADARVELRPLLSNLRAGPVSRIARTDGDGRWTLSEAAPGAHRLRAGHDGYLPATVEIDAADPAPHRLLLGWPATIRGSVIGLEKGEQASVHLWRRTSNDRGTTVPVVEEQFAFDDVQPGEYLLSLTTRSTEGSTGASVSMQLKLVPGEKRHVDLNARRGIMLSGRAWLGDDPLAGAQLEFVELQPTGLGTNYQAMTDEEGRCTVALQAASYEVTVLDRERSLLGQSRIEIEVTDDPFQEQEFRFSTGQVSGRIVDSDGRPVSGTTIILMSRPGADSARLPGPIDGWNYLATTNNDDKGEFGFHDLGAGEFKLAVQPRGYVPVEHGPVELGQNEKMALSDIVVRRGQSLRVQVLGPAGQPIANAKIVGIDGGLYESLAMPTTESRADGSATLKGLSPGSWSIMAHAPGRPPVIREGVEVTVDFNPEPLVMRFSRGGRLEVQVLDSEGNPVPDARISLIDRSGRDLSQVYSLTFGRYATDRDGLLVVDAVHPGTYRIGLQQPRQAQPVSASVVEDRTAAVVVYSD